MRDGSTGRRGNTDFSYILPDAELNRSAPGKELKAGGPARASPGQPGGSARGARTGGAGDRSLPHPQKALGAEAAAAVG